MSEGMCVDLTGDSGDEEEGSVANGGGPPGAPRHPREIASASGFDEDGEESENEAAEEEEAGYVRTALRRGQGDEEGEEDAEEEEGGGNLDSEDATTDEKGGRGEGEGAESTRTDRKGAEEGEVEEGLSEAEEGGAAAKDGFDEAEVDAEAQNEEENDFDSKASKPRGRAVLEKGESHLEGGRSLANEHADRSVTASAGEGETSSQQGEQKEALGGLLAERGVDGSSHHDHVSESSATTGRTSNSSSRSSNKTTGDSESGSSSSFSQESCEKQRQVQQRDLSSRQATDQAVSDDASDACSSVQKNQMQQMQQMQLLAAEERPREVECFSFLPSITMAEVAAARADVAESLAAASENTQESHVSPGCLEAPPDDAIQRVSAAFTQALAGEKQDFTRCKEAKKM
ncbi:cilia- and flagella-associated protein 251-like [Cyclospora cayetanensis]|uniref:Cilia- and flagella-associated protein 251-like n=1 Tax=Cyclospora cayetanensis TaxID=88456 RepID=A0A6P6RVW5_9EIME|nr:cilia- and flagella-associated protein 251-like [Cyclospora cayetanensis]